MRSIHLPVWLGTAGPVHARSLAALFTVATLGRALLVTLVPLRALELLGDAQRVSVLYFAISLLSVLGSFCVPWLVRRIRRRRVFTLGCLFMTVAPGFLALGTVAGLAAGLALLGFAVVSVEIALQLYVMDHIPRSEMGRFEPLRVFYTCGVWTFGPWFGVYLYESLSEWTPFALTSALSLFTLGCFWVLRLRENPAVAPAKRPPPTPLRYLKRYFVQPRLRLAWLLAVGRAGWWSMFFIYAPIYAVRSGLDELTAGTVVSVGAATLFLVPLWGWIARRYGVRRLLVGGYVASGLISLAVAVALGAPWPMAAILVTAALITGVIDGVGNVPFLRAVRPMERPEMTTVFATYRDVAQLVPPGLFALLLKVFTLPVVFVAGGIGMLVIAYYARYLPRRL